MDIPSIKKEPSFLTRALHFVASLKLTVVLFFMSLLLVFWGTWAQVDRGVWEVVNDYFRCDTFVMIPIKVLTCFALPQHWEINNVRIPYPGGYLLGWALFFNLLAAHVVRFKSTWQRSGIIILHAGILLMMLGEFFTGKFAYEGMITLGEGESANFVQDNRACELSFTDVTDDKRTMNDVAAVYAPALRSKKQISSPDLPVDLEVKEFMVNSDLEEPKEGERTPATRGRGRSYVPHARPEGSGVDTSQRVDTPSVVVALKAKATGEDLGTYVFSYWLGRPDTIQVGGKTYEVQLRPKRSYRDYTITLKKAEQNNHPGIKLVKDYSSYIVLNDPTNNVRDCEVHIYMNNPMRYRGEAFFQANMGGSTDGEMTTGLQVVRNTVFWFPVWWVPYAACVIVAIGMLFHFGVTLLGFLDVQTRTLVQKAGTGEKTSTTSKLFPVFVVSLGVVWLAYTAMPPTDPADGFHLQKLALVPVQEGGRLMPFDTYARAKLLSLSHRQQVAMEVLGKEERELLDKQADGKLAPEEAGQLAEIQEARKGKTQTRVVPAHEWALDTILLKVMDANPAQEMHAIRIDNDQLLAFLELKPSPQFGYYFKLGDFIGNQKFWTRIAEIRDNKGPRKDDMLENKLADLWRQIETIHKLAAFDVRMVPPQRVAGKAIDDVDWLTLAEAAKQRPGAPDANLAAITGALHAYSTGNHAKFNESIDAYLKKLNQDYPDVMSRNRTELGFNNFAPYYQCVVLLVAVIVLAVLSWITWHVPLRYAAWSLGLLTVLVYTWTLIVRVYLSGYAPVTNLYSSAIFIGWGCAVLCLALELILRNGIGSVLAGVTGSVALIIAHNLYDGDSMGRVVAVLNSNFWLSTHVICITFGYTATFVAGFLGIAYVFLGMFTPILRREAGIVLGKVMYGVICFAMFLSFVGTVLGGIWADQSWGRFWGWDPKENGALLIVIWNAIILHARWAGLVKMRGVAMLAIFGNAVTAWSWFGTNLLGVGLHSYGFAQGGLLRVGLFAMSQLVIIAIAAVPQRHWASFSAAPQQPS